MPWDISELAQTPHKAWNAINKAIFLTATDRHAACHQKSCRRPQRGRGKTKDLIGRTIAEYVHFKT